MAAITLFYKGLMTGLPSARGLLSAFVQVSSRVPFCQSGSLSRIALAKLAEIGVLGQVSVRICQTRVLLLSGKSAKLAESRRPKHSIPESDGFGRGYGCAVRTRVRRLGYGWH